MIQRIIGFLGLLASVMALSSLVYGAFQEPLGPYMQGIMGGILDAYRAIRDFIIGGLGSLFLSTINFFGQWLRWLPPAPWFTVPGFIKDILAFYFLLSAAATRLMLSSIGIREGAYEVVQFRRGLVNAVLDYFLIFSLFIIWPGLLFGVVVNGKSSFERRQFSMSPSGKPDYTSIGVTVYLLDYQHIQAMVKRLCQYTLGATFFFLLVYAENRIGL